MLGTVQQSIVAVVVEHPVAVQVHGRRLGVLQVLEVPRHYFALEEIKFQLSVRFLDIAICVIIWS